MTAEMLNKYQAHAYTVFRVLVGLGFFLHGLQKLGVFGTPMVTPDKGLFFLAMIFEVIIGPLIMLGLLTRIAAVFGAVEMFVAYVQVHMGFDPMKWNPLANNGEPALLYFACFIVLATYGAGIYSLDHKVKGLKKLA